MHDIRVLPAADEFDSVKEKENKKKSKAEAVTPGAEDGENGLILPPFE